MEWNCWRRERQILESSCVLRAEEIQFVRAEEGNPAEEKGEGRESLRPPERMVASSRRPNIVVSLSRARESQSCGFGSPPLE
jgi:hypothetical protein